MARSAGPFAALVANSDEEIRMPQSGRRRGFLLGVVATGAALGLNRLVRWAESNIPLAFWATTTALPGGTVSILSDARTLPIGTIQIYAGERISLSALLPVPAGAKRQTIVRDVSSAPFPSGVSIGTGSHSGDLQTALLATQGTTNSIVFRATYSNHADDLFGPYNLVIAPALPFGFSVIRGGVKVGAATQFGGQLIRTLIPNDTIAVQALNSDGSQRVYVGQYQIGDGNGNFGLSNGNSKGSADPVNNGPITIRSAQPGKRFRLDFSQEIGISGTGDPQNGNVVTVIKPNGFSGCLGLTLIDAEIFSKNNFNADASDGLVGMKGSGEARGGLSVLSQTLVIRNCHFRGGNCGITTDGPHQLGQPLRDDGSARPPVTGTIPNSAPYQVVVVPAKTTLQGQFTWAYDFDHDSRIGTTIALSPSNPCADIIQPSPLPVQINGVGVPTVGNLVAPGPGQYQETLINQNGIDCGVYTFNAADAGKSYSINYSTLAPNYATDTSSLSIYNSEFEQLGGLQGPCHTMYMGHWASMYLEGVWCHTECFDGYLVKSKGKKLTLNACRISSDPLAPFIGESASIDASTAGDVLLTGCLIIRKPPAVVDPSNQVAHLIIQIGAEWMFWDLRDLRTTRFRMRQCTVINYDPHPSVKFFQVGRPNVDNNVGGGRQRDGTPFPLRMANVNVDPNFQIVDCVFAGYRTPTIAGNYTPTTDPNQFATYFTDPANNDFSLKRPVSSSGLGTVPQATLEYVHPASTKARSDTNMGAFGPLR
jgi:hypothetical protein